MNQDLGIALHSMVFRDPSSWFPNLVCVEYVHNSLTISASGLSPFLCVYGYETPLLPALNREVSCPSALAYAQRC